MINNFAPVNYAWSVLVKNEQFPLFAIIISGIYYY